MIGDYLTEVNVTSPTCFREIPDQTGFNVAGMVLDALEQAWRRAAAADARSAPLQSGGRRRVECHASVQSRH